VEGSLGYSHFISESVRGDYQPLWGNFDGDGHHYSDVVWWNRAPGGEDAYWVGNGSGFTSVPFTAPHVDWSSHNAAFGDFDGNGALDILFYDATGHDTFVYYG
jgi:hypothetical protein